MNGVSVVDVLSVLALFLCLCAKKRTFLIASHGKLGNLYVMVVAKSLPISHQKNVVVPFNRIKPQCDESPSPNLTIILQTILVFLNI